MLLGDVVGVGYVAGPGVDAFPTRRSSDLAVGGVPAGDVGEDVGGAAVVEADLAVGADVDDGRVGEVGRAQVCTAGGGGARVAASDCGKIAGLGGVDRG